MLDLIPELNFVEEEFLNAYYSWTKGIDGAKEQLVAQKSVDRFRVDFLYKDRYVIEVDGQHYHEGENRRRDYIRERQLKRKGYEVIRFTAGEVMENARNCITEMMEIVYSPSNVWIDYRREVG